MAKRPDTPISHSNVAPTSSIVKVNLPVTNLFWNVLLLL